MVMIIRGVWLDGSKSHRMRHVSREVICMRNRDGSISKWLKISITCLFTEMAHFFEPFRFLWLKKWAISVKKHVIEILSHFEIEPSRFLMHMTSRETCLLRWLFEPSHHTPRNIKHERVTFNFKYSKWRRSVEIWRRVQVIYVLYQTWSGDEKWRFHLNLQ